LVQAPAPAADERTVLVRVMAASINPSDVKNVAGALKQTTLPSDVRGLPDNCSS
jgi:NADPH:quinone reductase-like Zn-dependent oxidoreductase